MHESNPRAEQFSQLFVELVSALAAPNTDPMYAINIKEKLGILAGMLHLSKGVTRVYATPREEQLDLGETIISYDLGIEDSPIHTVRIETSLMSIVTMTVYKANDTPELTDVEMERLDLTMRTAAKFISRNRMQELAYQYAFYDDQGFRNNRSFFRHLAWHGKPGDFDGMAAVNYNLRHFSLVNEQCGRAAGDKVLMNHYKHIEHLAGEKGIAARLGGDSFVCIFPQIALDELIDYLTKAEVPFDDEGNTVAVSATAGVFRIPDGYAVTDPGLIMGKIISALRAAQTGGQESIVFFDETMVEDRERAIRIQQKFPDALQNKEFTVYFQPKVNTLTGEICGAEALCRWCKDGTIIPPMAFIPILERTSDICKLDFYVLEQVCILLRRWLDEGRNAVRISVNFSRKHIINEHLHDQILGIVDKYDVPHEYIEIELTETTTEVGFRALQRIVKGLQEAHFFTSVDDFGIGYSSLNLIRVIPWNVLKVDRCFLPQDDESSDSISNIMFRNVVALAKEMGLETITEGVETAAQLQILRNNKCDLAQGYLFDKPLQVPEFEKRLDMRRYGIDRII